MSQGKLIRLNRVFGGDGKTLIAAMDHGAAGMMPLAGLEQPAELIAHVRAAGADAVMVTPGMARQYAGGFGRMGVIVRVDFGPTAVTGEWHRIRPVLTAEDALRLGADAVVAMGVVGAPGETESVQALTRLAADCERWGLPLIAEMLPGGFTAAAPTAEQLASAAHIGAEVGADLIKIRFSGTAESFRGVTRACYRPVVMLGGSQQAPEELGAQVRAAMEGGARGAAVGRNIWQAADPAGVARMLVEAVHG